MKKGLTLQGAARALQPTLLCGQLQAFDLFDFYPMCEGDEGFASLQEMRGGGIIAYTIRGGRQTCPAGAKTDEAGVRATAEQT